MREGIAFIFLLFFFCAAWLAGTRAHTVDMAGIILFCIAVGVYLFPYIMARSRNHCNATAIGALNILLGWTFIGWVVALVWSLTANIKRTLPSVE